ncbi:hypothetical protein ABBQ32_009742 [Trebouxia sp. C0010 RCD-2024]
MAKRKGRLQKVSKASCQRPDKRKVVVRNRQHQIKGGKRKAGATVSYDEYQRILCIGDGNFSFARALVRKLEGQGQLLTATAYDTKETVWEKYEEGLDPVSEIVEELQGCDAAVYFAVDATQIVKTLKGAKNRQGAQHLPDAFDRIIFNFPHIGLGIKDQDVNVRKNQQMLSSFFFSACEVLCPDGEIHVTLKDGRPYSLWNVVSLAHHATQGMLILKTTCAFHPADYPGYGHRRTLGFKEGESKQNNEEIQGANKTYVFTLQP